MATAAAAASGLRVMTTQRGPARADDDTPPKEPPAHAHRHRAATEPLPRMRIRLGDGVPAQRSAAQPARTAGGERSARRDLLGRWGGGAVVMAAVSGAVGSEIRSKMRRNNGIGAERGASPACCCVLLPGHECDSEQSPDPTQDSYVCGVHSVSSLCKMYFRELPNPLLSDRLYEQLSDTVLYHGASPCGCLLLPQSCSHWRRHRHRRGHSNSPVVSDSREIEAEEGPAALQGKFYPVSGFPSERKSPANEMKKSAAGSWHSCFSLGKSPSVAKQIAAQTQEPSEAKVVAVEGESNRFRPRRPRPSSGALCTSFSAELSGSTNRCSSDDNLPHDNSDGDKALICVPAPMSPGSAEDADLSPPAIAVASLDCDSVSFQCSPPHAESECPGSSTSMRSRKQQPAGHQSVSVVIRRLCWLSEGSTDHERSSLTIRGLH